MADFKITTRIKKEERSLSRLVVPVYISVAHNGETKYIKTNFKATEKKLRRIKNRVGEDDFEIKDQFILKECYDIIDEYVNRCNRLKIENMTCGELIAILKKNNSEISFTQFAQSFIDNMINSGRERPARNYQSALNSLMGYSKKSNLNFTDITSKLLNEWIISLMNLKTAKRAYPAAIKKIFEDGLLNYNDYDRGFIQITHDPFKRVKIPRVSLPQKRNTDINSLRVLFNAELPDTAIYNGLEFISREKQAQDVALLILCLAGINVADLYELKSNNLMKIRENNTETEYWKLCYNRKKTRDKREDSAYIEIMVPDKIKPLFSKYQGKNYLFDFAERYAQEENFCKSVNMGLKKIGKFTTYTLRHSWATIAQNHCGANMADIAFALNHVSGFKITERYVDIDYSPIDKLNEKVISFVFSD